MLGVWESLVVEDGERLMIGSEERIMIGEGR
jgi:hypothetical protein